MIVKILIHKPDILVALHEPVYFGAKGLLYMKIEIG